MSQPTDWQVAVSEQAVLRPLHRGDVAAVAEVAGSAFASDPIRAEILDQLTIYCDAGLDRVPLTEQRDGMPREYYALSTVQGEIVGVAGLYRLGLWTWPGVLWIGWFAVDPRHQRQRLGTGALNALLGLAGERGARILKVEALAGGEAVEFYLRHGFEREALLKSHYGPGRDAQVLSRRVWQREEESEEKDGSLA